MKKALAAIFTILIIWIFCACGPFGGVDTSTWVSHSFGGPNLSVLLPEDMEKTRLDDHIIAKNPEVTFSIEWTSQIFADENGIQEWFAYKQDGDAEITSINDKFLVLGPKQDDGLTNVLYGIAADGDTYAITISAKNAEDTRHAKKVMKAIINSITGFDGTDAESEEVAEDEEVAEGEQPADAEQIAEDGSVIYPMPALKSGADYLAVINARNESAAGDVDWSQMVSVMNRGEGGDFAMERETAKAFFALERALQEDGIYIVLREALSEKNAYPDNKTGLGLDIYPSFDNVAEEDVEALSGNETLVEPVRAKLADFGFIVRYPEGGEYYTGVDYDPWHIRYVGVEAAQEITAKGLTLEEYLGQDPASVDYLLLVNKKNPVPDDWDEKIELVYMTNNDGLEIGVELKTYEAYLKFKDALLKEGVHTDINTAYRSKKDQEDLIADFTWKYGEAYVEQYTAKPGFSEHHTGLAIDLYLESLEAWDKIEKLAPKYGFILRYPEGKEDVTGYGYEPWHIRYVGRDAAREIMSKGLTLEEYVG